MPKYQRVNLETLTNAMSNNTVTNKWDVLCSYDIKSLNKVLQEEHKKYSTNAHIVFNELVDADAKLSCQYDIKFGNPTVSFDANVDGIYNIKMPIETGSSFDKVLDGKLISSCKISQGWYLVASGPVQCIKGEGNTSKHDAGSIIEFGKNDDKASIVLHFGEKLRQIEPFIDSAVPSQDNVKSALEKISLASFIKNITEINYNITQVKVNSDKQDGIVLTPKSFIFTTMGSEDNEENGALNVWIQTNESKNEPGNPKPSFYTGQNLLPIPEGHNASIIFSKQLIQDLYLKPQLEKLYKVTNLDLNNKPLSGGISFKLIPQNNKAYTKDYSYDGTSRSFKCTPLEINYKKSPLYLSTDKNLLNLKWQWSQDFKFKYSENNSFMSSVGMIIKWADYTGKINLTASINKSLKIDKDSSKFSMSVSINENDVTITQKKLEDTHEFTFLDIMTIVKKDQNFPTIEEKLKANIKESVSAINIDLQSLNYFSEANILFNEKRFSIDNSTSGINVPGDVVLVGDIA